MRWVKELAVLGCHWSEKGSANRYHVLNAETDTSGPLPPIDFLPTPVSKLDVDSESSLADQVWAAGQDMDVGGFQMLTMSQLSASFN